MRVESLDLYRYYGLQRQGANAGYLTIYQPETAVHIHGNRYKPAILVLPGGGYGKTSPREKEPVALRFVVRGYTAYALDYSCAPARFPVALREAALAMRYIRENARRYEVNPRMVAAIGFSAGGHLCGCLGTMYDCPEVADIADAQTLRPDALGLCYPVAVSWGNTHEGSFINLTGDDAALRQRLSLDTLVRPDMPPVFLWHTRNDAAVPVRNSLLLADALDGNGVDFAMNIYRCGPHGLSTADEMVYDVGRVPVVSWGLPDWPEAMMAFFREKGFAFRDESEEVAR